MDIIDEIDRMHAGAIEARDASLKFHANDFSDAASRSDNARIRAWNALAENLVNNWPAISARLREAERKAEAWDYVKEHFVFRGDHVRIQHTFTRGYHDGYEAIESALAEREQS